MQRPYDQYQSVKVKENNVSSNGKSIKDQLTSMKKKSSYRRINKSNMRHFQKELRGLF